MLLMDGVDPLLEYAFSTGLMPVEFAYLFLSLDDVIYKFFFFFFVQ